MTEEVKLYKAAKRYLTIILGTAMVGFAVSEFYIPNKIVSGGVSETEGTDGEETEKPENTGFHWYWWLIVLLLLLLSYSIRRKIRNTRSKGL